MGTERFVRRQGAKGKGKKHLPLASLNILYWKQPAKFSSLKRHVELTAKVVKDIAKQLSAKGTTVDIELAEDAALAHHIFKPLDAPEHFPGRDARIASDYLARQGHAKVGRVIGMQARGILPETLKYAPLEAKILAYADYCCRGIKDERGYFHHKIFPLEDSHNLIKASRDKSKWPFLAKEFSAIKQIEAELIDKGVDVKKLLRIEL